MGSRLSYPTVDLSGKVAVVTGGNTGIGYETAKSLVLMGAHTIIACRSQERATAAIERMKEEIYRERPEAQLTVEYMQLDLASFQSTKDFTDAFKERNLPLHLLINNAGIAWVPYTVTADGYELQLQVNHLGHFLLTLELLPTLLDTAGNTGDCRIIFVSSVAHTFVNWEPGNMNAEQQYVRTKSYPKSKLYNVMTAYALQKRLQNVGITVSSLHPGIINTDITRGWNDVANGIFKHIFSVGAAVIGRSCKDGAATTINCAVNPQLNTQQALYYDSCRPVQSSAVSRTPPYAWAVSSNGSVYNPPSCEPALNYACFSSQMAVVQPAWRNVSLLSRNEEFQEEMWRTSIAIVEKYLSPHILEKYGNSHIAGPTDGASPTLEGESKKNLPASVDGPELSHEEQQPESTAEAPLEEGVQN